MVYESSNLGYVYLEKAVGKNLKLETFKLKSLKFESSRFSCSSFVTILFQFFQLKIFQLLVLTNCPFQLHVSQQPLNKPKILPWISSVTVKYQFL